jgi:curved DNA-binding protein CbpA
MDPYLTLKIQRDCTLTEVKETFRARVQLDHPDHGGDEQHFIKICTAYRMILSDLDVRAEIESSSRIANDANCSVSMGSRSTDDPYVKLLRRVSARSESGKSKSRPRRSDVPGSSSRMSKGAILGGLVALVFFVAEVVASILDHVDLGSIPAVASQIDPDRRTRPAPGEADPQSRTESIGSDLQADRAPQSAFQSFPRVQLDPLP